MRGTSRDSLARAEERVEPLLGAVDGVALGEELFAVARLLDSSAALRRALTDPSADPQAKAGLAGRLLTGKTSSETSELVSGLARDRWSEARDLADAVEQVGVVAVLGSAERDGALDAVEDELFRFGRMVEGDRGLASALSDRALPTERKAGLVNRLLEGKVQRHTLALARQAAAHPRGRSLTAVLDAVGKKAAQRRQRLVASVTAALPLTAQQRERLAQVLQRVYGRTMWLNVDVDPEVIGGLRIQVGDEVIDASVLNRLDEARRRLAG
jgi:F-type H+-transporting ATPase subunit delta